MFAHVLSSTPAEQRSRCRSIGDAKLDMWRGGLGQVLNTLAELKVVDATGRSEPIPILNTGQSHWDATFMAVRAQLDAARSWNLPHACTLVAGHNARNTGTAVTAYTVACSMFSPGICDLDVSMRFYHAMTLVCSAAQQVRGLSPPTPVPA
jgi:hypothetical protein